MSQPDIFTNVHKGIRKALFDTCCALGRAVDTDDSGASARELLRQTLRFVRHHGENEDLLLLPLLAHKAPQPYALMEAQHQHVNTALEALSDALSVATLYTLYHECCAFTALYLDHMRSEERELEQAIRAALTARELGEFGAKAVARTAPADQRLMLSWMLRALPEHDAEALLSRLPETLAAELREATRGGTKAA